jgi:hypothetical protein
MILALVYPIVLGLDRLETASFLRSNSTFHLNPAHFESRKVIAMLE